MSMSGRTNTSARGADVNTSSPPADVETSVSFASTVQPGAEPAVDDSDRTARLVALIPAHDEELFIAATIRSLQQQTRPPDRIVVMADNCTDDTVRIARLAGAEVVSTVDNTAKKAGALNQGLDLVLPTLDDDDLLLAMDADSQLLPEFIGNAQRLMAAHGDIGGLSGSIVARPHQNLLELAQAVEYTRGTRQTGRKGGRVHVLSGAATIVRADVLRQVAANRGTLLPGKQGQVFMEDSLTEDYEVTLAIRQLGYRCISTKHCKVVTDVMPTLKDLKIQRVRWYRGAMESLSLYGWTPLTHKTWFLVGITYLASLLVPLVIALIVLSFIFFDSAFDARWLAIWPVMMAEQYVHARRVGVRLRRMPLLFFPLWAYDIVLFYHCWVALNQLARQTTRTWVTGLVNERH
jgi:poly-beta-1,6-N-acetyl-D-glucosamine synthase